MKPLPLTVGDRVKVVACGATARNGSIGMVTEVTQGHWYKVDGWYHARSCLRKLHKKVG